MNLLLNHLLQYSEAIAFTEGNMQYSFKTFVGDIEKTEKQIKAQVDPAQKVFRWNNNSAYKNIVLLFAITECKGIVVPIEVANHLFENKKKKLIHCDGEEVIIYPEVKNVFTEELRKRNSPGIIISTSGTGSVARDIIHDFGMLCTKYLKLKTPHTSVLTFSLEHISGLETLLSILSPGGTIILTPGRDAFSIAEAIKKNQADLLSCTPTFLVQLYLKDLLTEAYFHSVKIINCGGEPLSETWSKRLQKRIPWVKIKQAFGTTEATNFKTETHGDSAFKFKPGRLNEDYLVKDNILYIRNQFIMLGDWNENKLNTESWIKTSDIVEIDTNGFLEFKGRSEKIISVGGKKVSPGEVEQVILRLPHILYAKVYGEANAIMGQIVSADILAERDETLDLKKEILDHCRKLLDDFKVPVKIRILKEIPMTERLKNLIP